MLWSGKLAVSLNTLSDSKPSFKYLLVHNFYFKQLFRFAFVRGLISQVVGEESGSDSQLMEPCTVAVKSGGLLLILPTETLGL